MAIFLPISSWNMLALICAALLLTTIIPLERLRLHRENVKKTSRLAWFSDLRRQFEETKDIKQLGDDALRVTLRILGATQGCVLLQGDQGRGLNYKAVQGLSSRAADLLSAEPLRPYFANSAERWGPVMVFSNLQEPEVLSTWHRDPLSTGFLGLMMAEGLRTAVLIGLGTPGKCYGAVLAGSPKGRFLKSPQLPLAMFLGNQLTKALEGWSDKRTTELHNEEWRVLNRVGLALRETFDFQAQIQILRRDLKDLLAGKDFRLSVQSSPEGPLEMVVPFEHEPELASSLGTSPHILEEHVVRTRSPLVVSEDWRSAGRRSEGAPGDSLTRSWCGVLLTFSDGTIGVLSMADYRSAISIRQLDLFQLVAREAAKAFENTRNFLREKERASRLALVNELSQRTAAVLNPQELLPDICRWAQAAFGYDLVYIATPSSEAKDLLVEAEAGCGREFLDRRIAFAGGLAGAAVESGKPLVADFLVEGAKYLPLKPGVRSGLSVPLRYQNEILGVFNVESRRERVFTQQDVGMAQTLAHQIAQSLHNARTYQAALEQAITDGLTGLKTHRYFMETAEREWRRSTRSGREFSVIMIDLDGFKEVNDRYGHRLGDVVLRAVAKVLSDSVRQSNVVARYGGDEFSILIPEANSAQAGAFAERMRANIENDPMLKRHGITASLGIGAFPDHGPTTDEVLEAADAGMYLAKSQNGNCVRIGPRTPVAGTAEQEILQGDFAVTGRQLLSTGPEAFTEYLHRIEKASLQGLGESYLLESVTSLARSIDFCDPNTRDHGQAVARWAAQIARQVGMSGEEVEEVRLAGVLHDIGKVGIPLAILSKPARLSQEEYELIKSHCVLGERILEPVRIGSIKRISRIVRHHHETFDGSGYPDRLKGERIPLSARILAVAEALDTIVSDRTYKKKCSFHDATFELHRCSGQQFDPQLVDFLLRAGSEPESVKNDT